jgi:quercetin dioxygenase-like cupin family protein
MADNWYAGNAGDDAEKHRGWLLGHFIEPDGALVRSTEALEIKWGTHPAGQQREGWTSGEDRSTLVILVSGRFRVDLAVGTTTLARQGDYITWGPGIDHSWQAERDSVVLTIRWPSKP